MSAILPERSVECFDGLGVQIFYRLLVASTDAIIGACVSIEGINSLGDSHLRGCHGCCNDQLLFSLSLSLSLGFTKLTREVRAEEEATEFLPRKESKYPFASF